MTSNIDSIDASECIKIVFEEIERLYPSYKIDKNKIYNNTINKLKRHKKKDDDSNKPIESFRTIKIDGNEYLYAQQTNAIIDKNTGDLVGTKTTVDNVSKYILFK